MNYQEYLQVLFANGEHKYADFSKNLSHSDYSWQHARGTAGRDERCDTYLDIHDIEKDAERIKMRRFMLRKLREIEEKEVVA